MILQVAKFHSNGNVVGKAFIDLNEVEEYVVIAGRNPFYANHPNNKHPLRIVDKPMLDRCNKLHKQYLLLLKECAKDDLY